MSLAVLTTEEQVNALTAEWQELAATLPASTPYSRPSWVMPWWRQRRALNLSWLCFTIRDGSGRLTGVLPLVRYPCATVRYAGHDLHDIAASLTANNLASGIWLEALNWLHDNGSNQSVELDTLDPHDRECLRHLPFSVKDTDIDPGAAIALPAEWDHYLSGLSPNRRKQSRWERRALARAHGEVTFKVAKDATQLTPDIDALWELRERSWIQRGRYAELAPHVRGQSIRDFLHELASAAGTDIHPAQVAMLTAGTTLVAADLLLRSDSRIWTPMTAFDPDHARFSPGRLLMFDCIRYAIGQGCTSLELGRGIEQYKFDLGARRYDLTNSLITVDA